MCFYKLALPEGYFLRLILPILCAVLVLISLLLVFTVVPNDLSLGAVQRVFYFHVASALGTYLLLAILLLSSVAFLATGRESYDLAASAAARVGSLGCTIVLTSGVIWGHCAWNTWWRWEPRLVSFLVLWLIIVAYVIFRNTSAQDERVGFYAAVLGIFAALNVPIVIASIRFVEQSEQLHPQVLRNEGLGHPMFIAALALAVLSWGLFFIWLWLLRFVSLKQEREMLELSREIIYRRRVKEDD